MSITSNANVMLLGYCSFVGVHSHGGRSLSCNQTFGGLRVYGSPTFSIPQCPGSSCGAPSHTPSPCTFPWPSAPHNPTAGQWMSATCWESIPQPVCMYIQSSVHPSIRPAVLSLLPPTPLILSDVGGSRPLAARFESCPLYSRNTSEEKYGKWYLALRNVVTFTSNRTDEQKDEHWEWESSFKPRISQELELITFCQAVIIVEQLPPEQCTEGVWLERLSRFLHGYLLKQTTQYCFLLLS